MSKYYAIQNKRDGRLISGTDFSRSDGHPRQILHDDLHPPRLFSAQELDFELKHRRVNLDKYQVIVVKVERV